MIAPPDALAPMPDELSASTRRRSCAPASPPTTRCATAARSPATWSPSSVSAASVISACSTRRRWASAPSPSRAARTRSRSRSKLGALPYIDSKAQDPAAELQKLGGAKVILATVTSGEAMTAVLGGLAVNGTLMVIGVPPTLSRWARPVDSGNRSIRGWYSGTSIDSEETLAFSRLTGVRSMNEVFPSSARPKPTSA